MTFSTDNNLPPPQSLHFLLIEDDDDHAEIVMRAVGMHRMGNSVHRVADGGAGLAYLRAQAHNGQRQPDIVLLDLKLPGRDGHEILREIKSDPALRQIPVIILTTSPAEADRVKAYDNLANSYIVKPISFSGFRQMLADLSHYWSLWSPPHRSDSG
ncbi:MAG: response regulator [Phycisphaerae bacterium]|nr:response regulator [Phycisphaerae bacterium]